tara:strand:- start:155 stop:466 length:312 start_codon:yes stop_codon:yes gene_type:complete
MEDCPDPECFEHIYSPFGFDEILGLILFFFFGGIIITFFKDMKEKRRFNKKNKTEEENNYLPIYETPEVSPLVDKIITILIYIIYIGVGLAIFYISYHYFLPN